MLRGIYTSASGMMTDARVQRVIGNNVSNVNTPGYRAQDAYLSPFARAYLARTGGHAPSFPVGFGGMTPMGSSVMGSRVAEISAREDQGRMQTTERTTDLAINGPGYFAVDVGGELRLTRAGNFVVDDEGFLATAAGHRLAGTGGPIRVEGASFTADGEGRVRAGTEQLGRIALVHPGAEDVLERGYDGLIRLVGRDPAEGLVAPEPEQGTEILQGTLELANADLVDQMTRLMSTFRSYGANHSAFRIQDGALAEVSKIIDNL